MSPQTLVSRRSPGELPPNSKLPQVLGAGSGSFARGREVAALLLWTFALFSTLALASYAGLPDGVDPSTPPLEGANWVGPVGAFVARGAVRLVGVAAWIVPVEAVLLGIPFVRGRTSTISPSRLAGDLLLVVLFASLVQVGWPSALAFGRHAASGLVGELFGEVMRSLFSTLGSFLVGFALIGLVLIGRASFSFIALLRAIARFSHRGAQHTAEGARTVADAWAKARELERERREAEEAANAPKIAIPTGDEPVLVAGSDDEDGAGLTPASEPRLEVVLAEGVVRAAVEPDPEPTPAAPPRRRKSSSSSVRGPAEGDATPAPLSAVSGDDDGAALAEALADVPDEPPLGEARPRARRPSKKKTEDGITIVDTSAALATERAASPKAPPRSPRGFQLPSVELLAASKIDPSSVVDEAALRRNAELLVKTLADYKVMGKVEEIHPGPVVTTFEVSPVAGTKVSKVASLADDLALALAKKVRIVAPIPGKNRIGFELPNEKRLGVNLRDLVEDQRFQAFDVPLPVVLGRDIVGNPVYADLAAMPHTIVAGATGAGKSVGLNVMLTSLLFRRSPEELRLLMIDPKVVELAPFDRIPHMLLPVVTDMKQASLALKWAVDEMERRYQLFADAGTKNLATYNAWVQRVCDGTTKNPAQAMVRGLDHNGLPDMVPARPGEEGEAPLPEKLPLIVIVVDEFADLMMQQGKDVEAAVARLAQKARAAGMHVILATQRPSVDVITGMIKANFPTRIAFRVAQKVDSRTILDEQGAEHLLGRGDMLIKLNGTNDTRRVQCPWVSEEEVQAITDHLRTQGEPVYDENILKPRDDEGGGGAPADDGETDAMYDDAVRIVAETRRCSTSWLQRKLGLGYNRAARIVETMERRGLVGPANGSKDREVLIDAI